MLIILLFDFSFQICNELQEFHASLDNVLRNTDAVTLSDIETLASKEDYISTKVRELREQQKYLDENIQASLDEAINIMEQSLNAVRMKMYGDFGDHSAVSTTALKVGLKPNNFKKQCSSSSSLLTYLRY